MTSEKYILLAVLYIPLFVLAYYLAPVLYLYLCDKDYRERASERNEKYVSGIFSCFPLPAIIRSKIKNSLAGAGIETVSGVLGFFTIFSAIILISLLNIFRQEISFASAFSGLLFAVVSPFFYIKNKTEKRNRAFIVNSYKIYAFLHSQISSGIKATDAVKGIHEIIESSEIKNVFVRFVARYELTLDIEKSLDIIRSSFSGYDSEMLCVSIEQCIKTGTAGKTLLKMEQIMFSKYFSFLQKDTQDYKTKLIVAAIFSMVPLVILFVSPVLYEAFKGVFEVLNYQ